MYVRSLRKARKSNKYHKRTFEEYILFLENKYECDNVHSYPMRPYGGGNPYSYCVHCHLSEPEINGDPDKHDKNCKWRHMYKTCQGLRLVLLKEHSGG